MNFRRDHLLCKNVTINGHRTSLRLEQTIWDAFNEICQREGLTVHQLFALIENHRQGSSRTSAVRTFIVNYLRAQVSKNNLHRKVNLSLILSEKFSGVGRDGVRDAEGLRKMS